MNFLTLDFHRILNTTIVNRGGNRPASIDTNHERTDVHSLTGRKVRNPRRQFPEEFATHFAMTSV
ncbi:MAG TPA: hypothetical protein DDX19_13625 [Rhodopirellula baltica]|uniref:Uncharacterized protein n=3 Tax=Rhodopirellula baltica TaxID=265606 RepID=Q7UK02_RHOBA|nr:hypothetical protein RBSH_00882 [Rhodopirellula baltica SH28]ELP31188.1 hypothetical protein RBSWK_04926 [Rhodopirellula baltica SWK14]CAD77079.1 hypothetical protein RB10944 [Rhodopirellula baltica SH 1]HBE63749.1 hypothetical protein [Rhodopirellula baltica]